MLSHTHSDNIDKKKKESMKVIRIFQSANFPRKIDGETDNESKETCVSIE